MNSMCVAVMANPGNMSDGNMVILFFFFVILAFAPFVIGLILLMPRILFALVKWLFLGGLLFVGWKATGRIAGCDFFKTFQNSFMEAYNKGRK